MDVVGGCLGQVESFDDNLGRTHGMELIAEVEHLVRRAIAEIRTSRLGFRAYPQAFGAAQLAHLQRHAVDKVSVFGQLKWLVM